MGSYKGALELRVISRFERENYYDKLHMRWLLQKSAWEMVLLHKAVQENKLLKRAARGEGRKYLLQRAAARK